MPLENPRAFLAGVKACSAQLHAGQVLLLVVLVCFKQ